MKTRYLKVSTRLCALAFLTIIFCVSLFLGLFGDFSRTANGVETEFTSIEAQLTVDTVYDDYDTETIKKALSVTGISSDGSKTPISPENYTVEFANGKLNADANDNAITVNYGENLVRTISVDVIKAEATPQISAVAEYTQSGAYYINGDGYYAFVQGMTAEQVQSRLAVALVYPNHTEYVPFDGNKVAWKTSAPSFGTDDNASDITVTISLSLTGIDGVEEVTEVSGDVVFAVSKRAALKLRDGWKQPDNLIPATTVQSFAPSLQGYVYVVMNSGLEGGTINVESELSYGGLYVGATAYALENCTNGDVFTKTLEIPYNGTDVKPLSLDLQVKYSGYVGIEKRIQGDLPAQIARAEKLNLGDIYVETTFEDADGIEVFTRLYLKNVPEEKIAQKFYSGSSELSGLTRSVTRISLTYTAPDGSTATGNFQGVQVSPIGIARPVIADKELTYSTEGCSTTISGLLTDDPYDDNMTVDTGSQYATYKDGVISFSRGGSYTITVSFNKANSDFTFLTGTGDGTVNPEDPTKVTYTVNVLKAPITVTLDGFPEEIAYGDTEPTYTVKGAVESNDTMQFTATDKIDRDELAYEDKTTEAPSYRFYYTGTLAKGGTYASYKFPTERGTYQIQVNTAETAWYQAGELKTPHSFTIVQRKITLTDATIAPVTFELGTEYSEVDVVKQVTVNDFAPADKLKPETVVEVSFDAPHTGTKITHAANYGVKITIINDNYKWSDTESTDQSTTFVINRAALSFTATQSDFTYGDNMLAAEIDKTGLNGYADVGEPVYTKDGAPFTAPSNGVWPAGEYKATYSIGSYTEGVLATDVECSSVEAPFTVARLSIDKVSIALSNSGQTYKYAAYDFVINNYKQGEQTLANGATYTYAGILDVTHSGLLTDGTTKITTITYNENTGVFSVTDAGTYTFTVSIKDSNFTWGSEGNNPQAITATAVIEQRSLDFELSRTEFSYTGENQFPETKVIWKFGEDLTATLTCAYYTSDNVSIGKNDIINADTYKVVVTDFAIAAKPSGAAYTYAVNYKLPENVKLPESTPLTFEITTPFLGTPTLSKNKVTYQGKNNPYDILNYIEGDAYTYVVNDKTLCKLQFTYAIGEKSYDKLAVAGKYTITVTPAENFKWNDGGAEPVEFTFTIDKLAVTLEWTESSLSSTYGNAPAPAVDIENKVAGDDVGIVIGYKDKDGINVIDDLSSTSNAGEYKVYAAGLNGNDCVNYEILNPANIEYTILKKELRQPSKPEEAIKGVFSVGGWSGSVNGFAYGLTSDIVKATLTGERPALWYAGGVAELFDTNDTSKYSFNVSSGAFTCYNAGYYSVEFIILDSTNYCWENSGKTQDFDFTGSYSHTWSDFAQIERQTITAPALGANRAMEWTSVEKPLSSILTGTLGNNIGYGVLYGQNKVGGIESTSQSAVDGYDSVNKTAIRGQYYALLTLTGDKYNYVWNVEFDNADNTGFAGSAFVNDGVVCEIIYTKDNGAQVKLYYAITASQVNVDLQISNYTYGDNGKYIGNTANLDVKDCKKVITLSLPAGFEDATFDYEKVSYTFSKDGKNVPAEDLVNGLPWEAGNYSVLIVITFDKDDVYQQWRGTGTFTVNKRPLEVQWSYNGTTGNSIATYYNGEEQMPTATITNMPSKNDIGDVTAPTLTYNLEGNEQPKDAKTYTVSVTGAGNNFNVAKTAECSFTINKFNVSISAVGGVNHVYGEAIADTEKVWDYVGENKFFNDDANNINLVILLNGVGDAYTSNKTPVNTYKLCPVWNNYTSLTLDENGKYTLDTKNYIIEVQSANFVVVQRQITVTFTENGATSVYGETVNLYQAGVIYNLTTSNCTGNAIVDGDSVTSVFSLTAKLNGTGVTGDSKLWAAGDYTVSGETISKNYAVTFIGTGKYVINNAEITNLSVAGYSEEYDAASHDLFTLSATTVNGQTVAWFYKNVNATGDIWLPYEVNGKKAQIKNVAESAVYYVKATAPNHNEAIFKVGETNAEIAVTVSKKELSVKINLTIQYGEANPAEYNGGYKATVDELVNNPAMYTVTGFVGSETISDINVSGSFGYTTDYSQGDNAGKYSITFVNNGNTLISDNYTFANTDGVLTVSPLALTVNISDAENVYYDTYGLVHFVTSVTLPVSTYTGETLTQSELAGIWDYIYDSSAKYEGANIITLTTTAFNGTNPDNSRTKNVGEYIISGTLTATDNYTVTFTGSNGTTAKHTITKAGLSVSDITGYNAGYDEWQHLALIVKRNGEVTEAFATAADGTRVTVEFYAADYADNAPDADKLAWGDLPLQTDPISYIDACHKNVYYRITAGGNYQTVYGVCEVEISQTQNAFTNENELVFKGWTYGLYDSTNNPNGYNSQSTHKIVEPVAKFTRLEEGGKANSFQYYLTRGGNTIADLTGDYETVSGLFAAMWKDGLFTAGNYTLTITMDGTKNYGVLTKSFEFTVHKKTLTVTAENKPIIYGDDAPEYTYTVRGFVAGKSDGVVDIEKDILGLNNKFFTSDYVTGREKGSVGNYVIKHFREDGKTVIDGLTDITLTNYSFTFVTGELSVAQREVTITISDAENFYNLSKLSNDAYVEDEVADWQSGYTVTNAYSGDFENGVQQIFELRTRALTSTEGKKTNNAGTYPIWAEWRTFENNGSQVSYGWNYTVKFEDCSYSGNLPDGAIEGGAGTYTIKQASLVVYITGPFNDVEGTENATNGSVFSNTPKYYKADVVNNADTVEFVLTYYAGIPGSGTRLDGAPVNVGKYYVTATTANSNYIAAVASTPFEITPAILNVGWVVSDNNIAATIEYGENIPALDSTNSYPANDRFTGLTYTFSSPQFADISQADLIAMLGNVVYGYTTDYNNQRETDITIAPNVTVSPNFTVNPTTRDTLRVIPRKITVQVNGYDERNSTATSKYTGRAPFADNKGWAIADWLKTVETDAFIHGHGLADLDIKLTISSQNYNASQTPYKVNVIKGNNDISKNYNVTFVVGDDRRPYSDDVKPTYLITKKDLVFTAKDVTVTYGNAIDAYVRNGISQSNLSVELFNRYFLAEGFENGETYMTISDSAMANNRFVFTTNYAPYAGHVGNAISLSIDASTIKFTNYEVTGFVNGKVIVVAREISASTHNEIYLEETDNNGNKVYHNGVYGASRNAAIAFDGHNTGIGYTESYAPEFTVSYNTTASEGQTAKAAPTKVGKYTVTVLLTTNDYVFAGNSRSSSLPFEVKKQTISPTWLHTAIANNPQPGHTVDLSNRVADYVDSIMAYSHFQKTVGDNVYAITEGTGEDHFSIGTVGSERVGLYITAKDTGEYRVDLTFKGAAGNNYQWNDGDSATVITIIFNVTTNKVYITDLGITGWIYKQYSAEVNGVSFNVSNGNKDGVQITYALITGQIPTDTAGFQKLSYSASIPEAAGNYAVRAYYPSYQGVGGDEQFTSFTIQKATLSTPKITVSGNNGVFGGVQLNSTVAFDPTVLRVTGYNGTSYISTGSGATLYAFDAGTYTVSFAIIDDANYQWGANASAVDWVVDKAENNTVTWNNTEAQRTLVYGNVFIPDATATYGGTVYYSYMLKTDDTEPGADDGRWVSNFTKFNVGDYWVKASNSGNDNYNGDYKIISFTVEKATLTVTPNGSMIYGNEFVNTNPTFNYVVTSGLVRGDDPDEVIKTISAVTYVVVDAPSKLEATTYGFVLASDENGNVSGLEADNYVIVSGTGVFTVNKRSIVVNIGNKTSQYGCPVDVSDVTVTYGSLNGLVEGDNLNLAFTTTATTSSDKGGYIINATYNNSNYNATVNPGTYTITERLITVEMVDGGGVYGENIAGVTYSKVLDDAQVDITDFVKDKLNISVVYSGTANDGTVFNGVEMPTLAGTYVATVKGSGNDNFIVVGEPFTQFTVSKKEVDGSLITIANQIYDGTVKVPVINSAAFVTAYGSDVYEELAHTEFIYAGNHYVTLRLKDADNYKWLSVEIAERDITFTIDKAENQLTGNLTINGWVYGEYNAQANSPVATVKFGQELIVYTYCDTIDGVYYSGAPITGNVGEYFVRATVRATDNYNTFESQPVKFTIAQKSLAVPTLAEIKEGEGKNDVYTGGELLSTVLGFDMALMNLDYEGKSNVSGGRVTIVAVDAGTYTVKISLANTHNYRWVGDNENEITLSWTIAPKAVAKPTENTDRFIVNGRTLTYLPEGFDEEIMTIDGNQTAYGGEFTVTVGLKDKSNYVWADGGVEDITFKWTVTGINTVFKVIVASLSGVCGVAVLAAGVQLLLDRRRKRLIDRDIDNRSRQEGAAQAATNSEERGNE